VTEILGGSANSSAVTTGGVILGLFGLAIAVGRFLSSTIKNLTRIGTKFIAGLAVFSILAILVVSYSSSPFLVIGAILSLGLAYAPMFPTIVGVTFARYEPKFYGSIFGIIFAIGLLGPMIVPKTIGKLSMTYGVQRSMVISAIIALLLCIVALLMGKSYRKQE
jgi:fucose permease